MGIALCHLQLAAQHQGLKTKFVFDSSKDQNPRKYLDYIATLELEN
jgi:hypothetical protein